MRTTVPGPRAEDRRAGRPRGRGKPLTAIEDDLRRKAEDVKKGLKKAGDVVKRTKLRLEDEVRETRDSMKRRLALAREVVELTRAQLKGEVKQTAREMKRGITRAKVVVRKTRGAVKRGQGKLTEEVRETAAEVKRAVEDARQRARVTRTKLQDEARFIRTWIENPLTTGAVTPSSPDLARVMASYIDPAHAGPVIELGPGTGPVTEALVARGVDEARLVLVEYDGDFCRLLAGRFPRATVVQGDAYTIADTLRDRVALPAAAVVSSLPLMTRPREVRSSLVEQAFGLMPRGAPFVQFTYALASPVPLDAARFSTTVSKRIWRNVPPARVWVYRSLRAAYPDIS